MSSKFVDVVLLVFQLYEFNKGNVNFQGVPVKLREYVISG